jgi:hypothetical protein
MIFFIKEFEFIAMLIIINEKNSMWWRKNIIALK